MWSPDLAELAEILCPTGPAEARHGLTANQLKARYLALPRQTKETLLRVANDHWSTWSAGRMIVEWDAQVRVADTKDAADKDATDVIPDEPPVVADVPGDVDSFAEGLLQPKLPSIERREEQVQMAGNVARALQEQTFGMIEASTGTGKTLAYLAPAAIWAMKLGARVIVSTHNLALPEQILEREVPLLKRLLNERLPRLGDDLRAAVIKGRRNYLCRSALERACEEADAPQSSAFLARLVVWSAQTKTGDRAELSLSDEEGRSFLKVSAANGNCSLRRCKYYSDGQCFLPKTRRRARAAHLVLTNHALLVTDRETRFMVPRGWGLIIDEGHELEDAATNVLTNEMSVSWLDQPMRRILRLGRNQDYGIAAEFPEIAPELKQELRDLVRESQQQQHRLFESLEQWPLWLARLRRESRPKMRLVEGDRAHPGWRAIVEQWLILRATVETICDLLEQLDFEYLACAFEAPHIIRSTAEVSQTREWLAERSKQLDWALRGRPEDPDSLVTWLEGSNGAPPAVVSAPLNVGRDLKALWKTFRSGVLTGATLTTADGFDFIESRLGYPLDWNKQYGSPYDYPQRTRLILPEGMPDQSGMGLQRPVADAIAELAVAANGRTMVLFTSYGAMNQTAGAVRSALDAAELRLLVQKADGQPAQVIQNLRDDPRVVVFGVDSLWTGVDIPGDNLSQLIIPRLPFPVPTDPLHAARAEMYENAFTDYTLQLAVMKFRQGFGRLMRKQTDRGVVVVLDGRIRTRPYRTDFVESVMPPEVQPAEWIRRGSVAQAAREISAFLDSVPISS